MKRIVLGLAVVLALTGCDNPHEGQVKTDCRHWTSFIPVYANKVMIMVPQQHEDCVWVTPTPEVQR